MERKIWVSTIVRCKTWFVKDTSAQTYYIAFSNPIIAEGDIIKLRGQRPRRAYILKLILPSITIHLLQFLHFISEHNGIIKNIH